MISGAIFDPDGVSRLRRLAGFVLALALSAAAAAQPEPPSVRSGSLFRIVGHGVWPRASLAVALEAAQAVARPAARIYGPRPAGSTFPRDIHLYRETADFVRREGEVTGGRFRHALAFSAFVYRNAHVALQPPLGDAVLAASGITRMTRRQIAHEAAHLYCFATVPSFRDHPSWYSEGAAMWIADRVMYGRRWSAGIGKDPVTATRIATVRAVRASGRAPTLARLFRDDTAGLATDERYAFEWAAFTFLMQGARGVVFERALARARRLAPGRDFAAGLADVMTDAFGIGALADLDRAFGRWLAGHAVAWEIESPSLEVRGPRWTQIAFPDAPAAAWHGREATGKRIVFRGRLTFLPDHEAGASLLIGHKAPGHLAVAFTDGGVALRAFESKSGRWTEIGAARFDPIPAGTAIRFQVAANRGRVRIFVGGELRLDRTIDAARLHGRWGVAVDEGAAVVWDAVRVRAVR